MNQRFFLLLLILTWLVYAPLYSRDIIPNMPKTSSASPEYLTQPHKISLTATDSIYIDKIFIIGNRKTKEKIIRRELDISPGMLLPTEGLEVILENNRKKIMNTRLFLSVNIETVKLSDDKADLIISVRERWYFFPAPIFELADRNFTEWWVNQHRDMSRVEYGLRLRQYNFRGRNETLSVTAQFGYTKLFRLSYRIPYINQKQKLGLFFYADYATRKNIKVLTVEHRQQFLDLDFVASERYRGGVFLSYRPSFYNYHQFGAFFASTNIADTVGQINPNYFLNGSVLQRYFGLQYNYTFDRRDDNGYPLKGSLIHIQATQTGIGIYDDISIFKLNLKYNRYADLGKKFYLATSVSGSITLPQEQPYNNYNGIGFNKHFIRGFERYIIEGQHYIMNNNSVKFQILDLKFSLSKLMPIKEFSSIPIAAYISANFDQGFIANYKNYENNDRFSNRYLAGGGVGIDIVSFYDFVMRWEYSFNIAGESALYLNILAAF